MHISQTFAMCWITLFFVIPYILWWIFSIIDIFKIKKNWKEEDIDDRPSFPRYLWDNLTNKQLFLLVAHAFVIIIIFLVITVMCFKAFK